MEWRRGFRPLLSGCLGVVCVCLTLDCPTFAQTGPFTADPVWRSGSATLSHCIVLGDVDADGDLDLVSNDYWESYLLYLNEGGVFGATPVWSSAPPSSAQDVALGDVDGDGYLDLVCANYDEPNALYRNVGGVFETTPAWTSATTHKSFGIALGDVDADGDLDLVCGSSLDVTVLYRNTDGIFEEYPAWSALPGQNTHGVALGDLDGDGDLDLVCGNTNAPNSIYLNVGDVFAPTPAWQSNVDPAEEVVLGDVDGDGALDLVFGLRDECSLYLNMEGTLFSMSPSWSASVNSGVFDVALGDVDADGDLDLICGGLNNSHSLFLNAGRMFEDTPAWSSNEHGASWSIALGDVDDDGDLDLVSGNDGPDALFENVGVLFGTEPAWETAASNPTWSIDLGDLDGDGDLDLVCADHFETAVYENGGGTFGATPAWWSRGEATAALALGDIDADGDLDLVCGNFEQSNMVYRNVGGGFEVTPAWFSEPIYDTYGIDLGDVDGDGDLDLVCANYRVEQPNTLYLNHDGMLDRTPAWTSPVEDRSRSVVLGDVDGDGDLDLVCGNSDQNRLYRNEGGTFAAEPAWSSANDVYTLDVTLGDVDGDGDLDLVCGNAQQNTLYWNVGGTFEATPSWSSLSRSGTPSVVLADMDGDGDLDLVCGNGTMNGLVNNTWYRNDGGVFESTPAWTSTLGRYTQSIAVGDVDRDGDLDLVCGNREGQGDPRPNTLYRNLSRPEFKSVVPFPRNHLPNNPAQWLSVNVESAGENLRRVRFVALDVESDPFWLIPEYHYEGSPIWHPVEGSGTSGRVGPFVMSDQVAAGILDWNLSRLPFDRRDVVLRLRMVEIPQRTTLVQHISTYLEEMGPIVPHRPQISSSPRAIAFEDAVTLGDTLWTPLTVSNGGNEVLIVSAVSLPSTELRIDSTTPVEIPPGAAETMSLFLEPRKETNVAGDVLISSNDPLAPVLAIAVSSNIKALDVDSRLLSPADSIPLGEAVTVIVEPEPDVHVERGWLLHRPAGGATTFQDSIPLSRSGEDFIAVIPGDRVTEAGLDYYVRVENSGVFSTDPPAAPTFYYEQPVEVPVSIVVQSRPTYGSDYLAGREINVEVFLPQGARFVRGALHYRRGGDEDYAVDSLVAGEFVPVATIPDSVVGPRGVEYWVEVQTQTTLLRSLTDPPVDPRESPRALRVRVKHLAEERTHAGEAYRMISIPLELDTETVESLLSDQGEFGPYDPLRWRLFHYASDLLGYVELSEASGSAWFRPSPARGFWLVSREAHRIDTAPVDGFSVATDRLYEIPLRSGWNQIGCPFAFPVAWTSCVVDTLGMGEAETRGLIEPPVRWSERGGYELEVHDLRPFEGYWIRNLTDATVILRIPADESESTGEDHGNALAAKSLSATANERGWTLGIRAESKGASDPHNVIGVRVDAEAGWDRYDRSEPPMSPGRSVSLHFPHAEWDRNPGRYTADVRGVFEALKGHDPRHESGEVGPHGDTPFGLAWHFDVAKSFSVDPGGDEVTLEISGIESVPAEAGVYLIDRDLGGTRNLRESNRYTFFQGKRVLVHDASAARFALLVGNETFLREPEGRLPGLPTRTTLHQNRPNPFNPATVIRYELSTAGPMSLRIYDVRGTLVTTLVEEHRKAGRYETAWNGRNGRGDRMPSGVYFCQLKAGTKVLTKKMMLLK